MYRYIDIYHCTGIMISKLILIHSVYITTPLYSVQCPWKYIAGNTCTLNYLDIHCILILHDIHTMYLYRYNPK